MAQESLVMFDHAKEYLLVPGVQDVPADSS